MPSDTLQQMIWPWIEQELERIWEVRRQADAPRDTGMTAVAFLRMLKALRRVILQDAAAMFTLFPDRRNHCFFRHPLFLSHEYVMFCKEMEDALGTGNTPSERATIDSVLPGINGRFDRIEGALKAQEGLMQKIVGGLEEMEKRSGSFESDVRHAAAILAGESNSRQTNNQVNTGITAQGAPPNPSNHDEDEEFENARQYVMVESFTSVQQMLDCWFGNGNHRNLPIEGGICACEQRWKNRWRKHWDINTDQKKLSRLRTIVLAIDGDDEKLRQLERFWQKTQSLHGLVKECETLGYRVRANRKK